MKFKYVMEFADGDRVSSTLFSSFEDCYLALPFNWDIYEGKVGGNKEDDIELGKAYFENYVWYSVYDGSMPELIALVPIALHIVDISIVKVL